MPAKSTSSQPINIPRLVRTGVDRIASLSDDEFGRFRNAVEGVPDLTNSMASANLIGKAFRDIAISDMADIVQALNGLGMGMRSFNVSVDEFVNRVVMSLERTGLSDDIDYTNYRARLTALLSLPNVLIAAKAIALFTENERVTQEVRITSDLRPVFRDEIGSGAAGAMVINTLRVDYIEGSERKQFFAIIDSNDIRALREACDRAFEKDLSLKAIAEKADLQVFKVYDDLAED